MKTKLSLILIMLISASLFAQKAVAPHDKIEKFYKTTTCVVYDSDIFNTYNKAIETAVKQSWTVTPYKFITMDEFQKLRSKPEYSFLIRTKVYPDSDKRNDEYTFLTLVLGERDKNFDELTEICSFPLSYYNVDYDKYDYKMGALLLFVQNHIKITFDNPDLNETNIINYYNKNVSDIGSKTIYFNAENLASDVNTLSKISAVYDGKVKLTDADDIQDAIDSKKDVVIMHIVTPPDGRANDGKCYKMLLGASDGKLYYFDNHSITKKKEGKFLKDDFKKLK